MNAAVLCLREHALGDEQARLVLADALEEGDRLDVATLLRCPRRGPSVASGLDRPEVMRLWCDELPARDRPTRKRVVKMTSAETARMAGWAQKWIEIGLRTGKADRPLFEAAVHAIYRHLELAPPAIVWTPAPIVPVFAGPIAAALIAGGNVDSAVDSAVGSAVNSAVHSAVHSAVDSAVHSAVRSAVGSAVRSAVDSAVGSAVNSAVHSAVDSAVHSAVHSAEPSAVRSVLQRLRYSYLGGQFWPGWYWGSAYVTFMLDVLGLDIGRDLELRARTYEATIRSACYWFPTKTFVIASERPTSLDLDGSGRLKRARWEWDGGAWEVRP